MRILLITLLLFTSLTACDSDDDNKVDYYPQLIGQWRLSDGDEIRAFTLDKTSDGSYIIYTGIVITKDVKMYRTTATDYYKSVKDGSLNGLVFEVKNDTLYWGVNPIKKYIRIEGWSRTSN